MTPEDIRKIVREEISLVFSGQPTNSQTIQYADVDKFSGVTLKRPTDKPPKVKKGPKTKI